MKCPKCRYDLGRGRGAVAGISILVEGDEVIFSYFRCPDCAAFSAEGFEDRFMSDHHTIWSLGEIPESEARQIVELVKTCPEPHDKHCNCASHKALYTGRLRGVDAEE